MRIRLELNGTGCSYAVRVFVNGLNAKTGLRPEVEVPSDVRDYTPLHYVRNEATLVRRLHTAFLKNIHRLHPLLGLLFECQQGSLR